MIGNSLMSGFMFLYAAIFSQSSPPLEIELDGKEGMRFQMKMIHCPPGESFISPENKTNTIRMKGFYISDFKVTTKQIVAMVGSREIDGLKKLLTSNENNADSRVCLDLEANYPFILATPELVVKFCLELQKQYSLKNYLIKDSYEGMVFKIPSQEQWVYAARGVDDGKKVGDNPYFAFTLLETELKILPGYEKRKADLGELWKKLSADEFKFEPGQIVKILERKDYEIDEMEKLKVFLIWYYKALTKNDLENKDPPKASLLPQQKSRPNAWGFRGSLDPSAEWVMPMSQRNAFWKPDYKDFVFEKSRWNLAGVQANLELDPGKKAEKLRDNAKFLFVSSLKKLNENEEYITDDFDPTDSMPSFRIVAETGLVHDWLFFVNRDIFAAENPQSARDKINEMRNYIKDLSGSDTYMKLFDSLVSIYQFRSEKKLVAGFQKAVGYFQSDESPDKDFFELLSKAVEN
jgi:hypothetical protein